MLPPADQGEGQTPQRAEEWPPGMWHQRVRSVSACMPTGWRILLSFAWEQQHLNGNEHTCRPDLPFPLKCATPLVAQQLRICLPILGTQARAPVWEASAHPLQPTHPTARSSQVLKPVCPEPVLRNQRSSAAGSRELSRRPALRSDGEAARRSEDRHSQHEQSQWRAGQNGAP